MPVSDLLAQLPPDARKKISRVKEPEWTDPMLATLTRQLFSSPDWIYERKLDGERILAFREGDGIRLLSRNRKPLNATYPDLAGALNRQAGTSMILDGEVVAFKGDRTSFEVLQERMQVSNPQEALNRGIQVYYYAFDLLYVDGYDVTRLPLVLRKQLLKQALPFEDPIRYLGYRRGNGAEYFHEACRLGWEGLIAKYAHSVYEHRRSDQWLKFKCLNEQEFVIGGYTEPHGKRICLGALLVGYYQDGKLRYAGKVGTGYSDDTLRYLCRIMAPLEARESPFTLRPGKAADGGPTKEVHWLEPQLVAQIGFEEWTQYGKLRQPRFMGIRNDKNPKDVVREDKG